MNDFVSVIIPALNVERFITPCIESLLRQSYPHEKYEIIVVDNGSQDKTVENAEKFNVRIFKNIKGNISILRNLGAKEAKGEILAFIDADCCATKDWLSTAVYFLNEKQTGAVGCWYSLPENPAPVEAAWDVHMNMKRTANDYVNWVPGGNFILAKSVFNEIGGFNDSLITGEDFEICERIRKNNYRIYSHDKINVIHYGNLKSFKGFFIKQYWHGKGGMQILLEKFPSISLNSTIIYAVLTLILLCGVFTGLFLWFVFHNPTLFIVSSIILLTMIFGLTIRTMARERSVSSFAILAILYLLFGISRGLALFDFKTWRQIIKGKKA